MDSLNPYIKRLTEDDVPRCREIVKKCFNGSVSFGKMIGGMEGLVKEGFIRRAYFDLKTRRYPLYVYREGGEVLGMVGIKGNTVRRLYVDTDKQKEGVGSKLLDYVEAVAVENGLPELVLYSFKSSVEFYVKEGYEVVAPFIIMTKMGKKLVSDKK